MQKCVHVENILGIVYITPVATILKMFNQKSTHQVGCLKNELLLNDLRSVSKMRSSYITFKQHVVSKMSTCRLAFKKKCISKMGTG